MTDLVWKPERNSLRRVRDIICEVPELLMDILEHDYANWDERPEDPIEIRYSKRFTRGMSWKHLLDHPPFIDVVVDGEAERFMPVFEPKYNPYRKKHGPDYWAWYVLRWELVPPEESDEDHQRRTDRS